MLGYLGSTESAQVADEALALARQPADPILVIRALVSHGLAYAYEIEVGRADFAEAIALARELDDRWLLSQILRWHSVAAMQWAITVPSKPRPAKAASLPKQSVTSPTRVYVG